jgi:hypothetical protein
MLYLTAERTKLNKIEEEFYVGLISLNENGSLLLPLCVQYKIHLNL